MKIMPIASTIEGIPDYYAVYTKWYTHYEQTGDERSRVLAYHYGRVAEEMGQAIIDEDTTVSDYLCTQEV